MALTRCSKIRSRGASGVTGYQMSTSTSGIQPVEVWWNFGLVCCKSCRSSATFLQPLQHQLITYNLLKDSLRCLNDAVEVACNSGLKESIADGMSAEGAGWWRGKEACEEGTRLYPASFVYIYSLESAILICKIRYLGVLVVTSSFELECFLSLW